MAASKFFQFLHRAAVFDTAALNFYIKKHNFKGQNINKKMSFKIMLDFVRAKRIFKRQIFSIKDKFCKWLKIRVNQEVDY